MNPDSLDSSIQGALAALYPPFEATAPTVLSQLFRVIEERYRGDALQCLLDFLIPAKHILESVQQAACATYSDVLFRCEGWPLCLREKVVIQLASINPLLLHPGDFYLQVEPFADQAARIVLKSLLEEYRQIEEMPLPETSYPCIFTEEWLRCINEGRHGTPLRRCLLSTDQGIVKVPWAQVAKPEFVDKPKATTSSPMPLEKTRILPAKDGIAVSLRLVDSGCSQLIKVNQCKPAGKPVGWVAPNTWDSHSDRELEGDYVDLVEFTKEKEALAFDRGLPLQKLPALRPVSCRLKEPRCRYRESYLEALQNPVSFEKGGTLAILEESSTNETDSASPASESEPPPYCHALHCCPELVEDQGPCLPGVENTSPDQQSRNSHPGRVLSHSCSSVSETYRKSPAMQAQAKRSISDVCPEMIPRVHVMQCKKGSAFGLMSPKTDKRRSIKQGESCSGAHTTLEHCLNVDGGLAVATHSSGCELLLFPSGSRDRNGRAVVELYGDHQGWRSPLVTSQELCKLLLYFHSIPRREVGDLGMTLVTDARKMPPPPTFYKALLLMQEQALNAVHCVLLLVDKEISPRPEKQPGLQMEIMTSLKALHKVVEGHQLTTNLEGTFPYSHVDWLQLHQKLNPFMLDLRDAASLLQNAIQKFEGNQKVDTAKDAQQRIHAQKTLMKEVLEDTQLVALQREGGAMLARLRREESRFAHSEDYRDYMDAVSSLYNVVEERVHMLVRSSNQSLQHLEFLLKLRELEEKFNKGERRLLEAKEKLARKTQYHESVFKVCNIYRGLLQEQKHQAMTLVTEAEAIQGSSYAETEIFRTMVYTFKSGLADFLSRAEQCRGELETMVNLCRFCEKATELAKDCREYLEQIKSHSQLNKEDLVNLKKYREQFSEYSVEFFQEIKAQACALKGSRGMRIWNVAWLRCQEVHQLLEERLHSSVKVKQPLEIPAGQEPKDGLESPLSALSTCVITSPPKASLCDSDRSSAEPVEVSMTEEGVTEQAVSSGAVHSVVESGEMNPTTGAEHITTRGAETDSTPMGPSGCEWFPWHQGLGRSLSEGSNRGSILTELQRHNPSHSHNQPSCQMLQAAQHFQVSRHGSFCSEDSGCGPGACSLDTETLDLSSGHNLMSEGTTSLNGGEAKAHFLRLQRIVEELLVTEREYVRSLGYILDHYYPLLERPDVPQDLRGQRGRVFGNLEKLHDFHHHCFLKELEGCLQEPVHVGRCFLKHRESFHLYALYSKNKPQSDSLLIHHSHDFFQKQREMGDNMDLSSYLLKPVQRISKYNLLLQDMLKECEALHGSERARIQAALEMVRFQLRHGNDLLAMDDIQDCDVNLKEQGQLICQDEFLVSFRKKKCFRHIFLFQDLILFSKTKKTAVGNDIYIYKQSFKTSDIGMTHNSGDSGLCFEIWFRRRKSQDTYILQAKSAEVKEVWTRDLGQILWEQAVRNRELRMQERVFMGMGSKPFMDIQPSEAAICDRAVKCTLTGRGTISLPTYWVHRPVHCCSTELILRIVCLPVDSSESSGESVSGFSGSDRSCQSVTGGEADDTSSISSSLCSKTHGKPLYFRERVSPVVSRRRPLTTPIPQALNSPQGSGKVVCNSQNVISAE
uniref:Si:dkey-65j6.2 n=1 Tax=Scleropages formosus TaxID=113540 RepID=A0A8C9V5C5_SCLFO